MSDIKQIVNLNCRLQFYNFDDIKIDELNSYNLTYTYDINTKRYSITDGDHYVYIINPPNINEQIVTPTFANLPAFLDGVVSSCQLGGGGGGAPPADPTIIIFQGKDCAGVDVGVPESVQKTIVLNKTITDICNVDEIVIPIVNALSPIYNNNVTQVNAGLTPIVLNANTYNSVSISILSGSATIDNDGVPFVALAGYSKSWSASTLLTNVITVTATSVSDLIVIDTIN